VLSSAFAATLSKTFTVDECVRFDVRVAGSRLGFGSHEPSRTGLRSRVALDGRYG